jgi:AAHS family 4-hydroxybenzoate transporter-like MFS transporter
MANKAVSVTEVFDANPMMSSYQKWVCFLCFLVMFLDGFDATGIGVVIPKIAEFLHTKMSALGLAVSASLVGSLTGSIVLGTLADRVGRKWMLVVCSFIFGLFSLLSATITNVEQLIVYRFIAGLGPRRRPSRTRLPSAPSTRRAACARASSPSCIPGCPWGPP